VSRGSPSGLGAEAENLGVERWVSAGELVVRQVEEAETLVREGLGGWRVGGREAGVRAGGVRPVRRDEGGGVAGGDEREAGVVAGDGRMDAVDRGA
jgi:hypothetical protein